MSWGILGGSCRFSSIAVNSIFSDILLRLSFLEEPNRSDRLYVRCECRDSERTFVVQPESARQKLRIQREKKKKTLHEMKTAVSHCGKAERWAYR